MPKKRIAGNRAVTRHISAALLLGLSAAGTKLTSAQSVPPRAAAPMTTLTGTVSGADGGKISGATVSWVATPAANGYEAQILATAHTDDEGRFSFADALIKKSIKKIGPKKYEGRGPILIAQTPDKKAAFGQVPLELNAPAALTFSPTTELRVPVAGSDGKPIPGVRLQAVFLSERNRGIFFTLPAGMIVSEPSGADGVCVFPPLPQNLTARIEEAGGQYAQLPWQEAQIRLGASPVTAAEKPIKLLPGATVSGRVVYGPNGKPASGVRISAQGANGTDGWATGVTDAQGMYRLSRLPAGAYNIALDSDLTPDWTARAHENVSVTGGQIIADKDFPLIKGGVIAGSVTGEDGKTLANVPLGVYGPAHPQSSGWVQRAVTDAQGKYALRVPGGKQYLYIMTEDAPEGYALPADKSRTITVTDGKTLAENWKLPAGPKSQGITGIVVGADGKPVAEAEVRAQIVADGMPNIAGEIVRTDTTGAFRFEKQRKTVTVRARKGAAATVKNALATPGDKLTLSLTENAFATIKGSVTDADGKILPNARVQLEIWKNGYGMSVTETQTDAQGVYTFAEVWPDNSYNLQIQADGYGQKGTDVFEPKPGASQMIPAVTLRPANGVAAGKVVDANGDPMAGVRVSVSGRETPFQDTVTDANGRFRLERIVDEKIEIRAEQNRTTGAAIYVDKPIKNLAEAADVILVMKPAQGQTDAPADDGAAQSARANVTAKNRIGRPAPEWNPVGWVNAKGKLPSHLSGLRGKWSSLISGASAAAPVWRFCPMCSAPPRSCSRRASLLSASMIRAQPRRN